MKRWIGQSTKVWGVVLLIVLLTACQTPTPMPTPDLPTVTPFPRETIALASPVPRGTALPEPATFTPAAPTVTLLPPPSATLPPTATAERQSAAFVMPGTAATPALTPTPVQNSLTLVAQFLADELGITANVSAPNNVSVPPPLQSVVDAVSAGAKVTSVGTVGDGTALVFLPDSGSGIEDDSLGVVVFHRTGIIPADENTALTAVQTAFPALAGVAFAPKENGGNAVPAPGKVLLPPPGGGTPQPPTGGWEFNAAEVSMTVRAGIFPTGENQFDIFAVVGRGRLAEFVNK